MASTKRIIIEGDLPYDCGTGDRLWGTAAPEERDAALFLREAITRVVGPVSGLKLSWTKVSVRIAESRLGGSVAHYGFRLSGTDAVSRRWIEQWMVATHLLGGRINYVNVEGLDTASVIYDIGDPSSFGRDADPKLRLWIAGLIQREYPGMEISI